MWTFTEYCDYDDYDYDFGEGRVNARIREQRNDIQLGNFCSGLTGLHSITGYITSSTGGQAGTGSAGLTRWEWSIKSKGKATHFHRRSVDWARSVSSSITIIEQPNVNYEIAPRCDWTSGKQIILQLKAISKNASELNENRKSTCSLPIISWTGIMACYYICICICGKSVWRSVCFSACHPFFVFLFRRLINAINLLADDWLQDLTPLTALDGVVWGRTCIPRSGSECK